jgi:hypothetical protein
MSPSPAATAAINRAAAIPTRFIDRFLAFQLESCRLWARRATLVLALYPSP